MVFYLFKFMIYFGFKKYCTTSNQIYHRLFLHRAKKMENLLKPPDGVYLMENLEKKSFEKPIKVPVINTEKVKVSSILPLIKKYMLKMKNFKSVDHVSSDNVSMYLNPEIINKWSDFSDDVRKFLEDQKLTEDNFQMQNFTLKYENYTFEDIFHAVLPKDQEGFSSFTKVGQIVHVNLREHLIPYKNIIGQVLLDKVPNCKSVVNKTNMIDSTYRNFQMEVLKGENKMLTEVKENNCRFEFDFSTVYWNSRLCTEHARIVKLLKPNYVLFDVFAGVGPFSLPSAKKRCKVFANDLNPESYRWLLHNQKLNKISDDYFTGYNLDGREFILTVIKDNLPKYTADHEIFIVMNLPAMAVEFLDAFIGLFKSTELSDSFKPITVYVYCFAKGENPEHIARNLILENLKIDNVDINSKITDLFRVRTVSSMKEMIRVTLSLDNDILVGSIKKRRFENDDNIEGFKKVCSSGANDKNGQEQVQNKECVQSGRGQESKDESQS